MAPIAFGLDKFFDVLVDWERYLAPEIVDLVPGSLQIMLGVGVVEIVAGLVVALRPRVGGYLVAAWLGGIIVSLLLQADFYDIALRDFGLLIGAVALARLATGVPAGPPVTDVAAAATIAVIGAGLAGAKAAEGARASGFEPRGPRGGRGPRLRAATPVEGRAAAARPNRTPPSFIPTTSTTTRASR